MNNREKVVAAQWKRAAAAEEMGALGGAPYIYIIPRCPALSSTRAGLGDGGLP